MPAFIALVATAVSALPSVGSSTIASTLSLMRVSIWLICWLTSLVPSAVAELDVAVLLRLVGRCLVDGGEPAVVGLRTGEADGDLLAGGVVVAAPRSRRCDELADGFVVVARAGREAGRAVEDDDTGHEHPP